MGYIRRAELRFAVGSSRFLVPFIFPSLDQISSLTPTVFPPLASLEKARRQRHLTPHANCTFNLLDGVQLHPTTEPLPSDGDAWGFDAGEHDAAEIAAENGDSADFADFGPFVDQVSSSSLSFFDERDEGNESRLLTPRFFLFSFSDALNGRR